MTSYVGILGRVKRSMQRLCNCPNVCRKPKGAGCASFEITF